jgi:hypothetical protein
VYVIRCTVHNGFAPQRCRSMPLDQSKNVTTLRTRCLIGIGYATERGYACRGNLLRRVDIAPERKKRQCASQWTKVDETRRDETRGREDERRWLRYSSNRDGEYVQSRRRASSTRARASSRRETDTKEHSTMLNDDR